MYKDYSNAVTDVTEIDAIKNSIKNIILTRKGSVPGKPYFGSDIHKLVFNHIDHLTVSLARNILKESLSKFEDRILVNNIIIEKIEEYNKILIEVRFSLVGAASTNEETVRISFNV